MPVPLTAESKALIFDRIWREYVETHGLGGMAKSDLDALLLWEWSQATETTDNFLLSSKFKIRESRVRSLLETAAIKFDQAEDVAVWILLLDSIGKSKFSVESLERGQVRFHLTKPQLFRYLQRQARSLNDSFEYRGTSEHVIANLETLYKIFDNLWEPNYLGELWRDDELKKAHASIKAAVKNIGKGITKSELQTLREKKGSKLATYIANGAKLASIGSFIAAAVDLSAKG